MSALTNWAVGQKCPRRGCKGKGHYSAASFRLGAPEQLFIRCSVDPVYHWRLAAADEVLTYNSLMGTNLPVPPGRSQD